MDETDHFGNPLEPWRGCLSRPKIAPVSTPIQSRSSGPVEIHYATVFDGKTPTLHVVVTVSKPATSERRYVSCRACPVLGARTFKEAAARLRAVEAESTAVGE